MKIYGPAFDKEGNATGKLVEREILPAELAAYAAVGYKEGELTPEAIAADKAAREEAKGEEGAAKKSGKLPEDFPGRTALEDAGITTYAQVRKALKADELKDIPGIGDVTLANITGALD